MVILWLSVISITGFIFLSPSREAISLVCEAVPGTKGALRKRKVHGCIDVEGGRETKIE